MEFTDFRLIWLDAFVKAAETSSFSAAALTLGVDKSSVSRYVGKLEEWHGGLLFTAGSVPLELQPDGQRFLPKAREILRLLQEARHNE